MSQGSRVKVKVITFATKLSCGGDPGSCDVCRVTEGGQKGCLKNNCKTNNVGYVGTCVTCQQMGLDRRYEGETARTLKDRSREHLRSINKKDESNGLYKHVKECHGDQLPTIRFQVSARGELIEHQE